MEEKRDNDKVGQGILNELESVANSTEVDRVYKFLQEVEQITKLTVGLQIRLNRAQRLLQRSRNTPKEKVTLTAFETWNVNFQKKVAAIFQSLFDILSLERQNPNLSRL